MLEFSPIEIALAHSRNRVQAPPARYNGLQNSSFHLIKTPMRQIFSALPLLLLAGCYNDSATYYADSSQEHTLTVRRQQDYFWSEDARYTLMAVRMPDCQRQIPLAELPIEDTDFELFAGGDNHWSLRSGKQVWQVETPTCSLVNEGGEPVGQKVGTYHAAADKMTFQEEAAPASVPGSAPATAPAPASAPAPAAN